MAPKPKSAIERFHGLTKRMDDGCLVWTGWIAPNGYAKHWVSGKNISAHRWSYEYHVGPIPAGLEIDHLCRNRACVNPDHLEPVTAAENRRRSRRDTQWGTRKRPTHCLRGHLKDASNVYATGSSSSCKTCKREASARLYRADPQKHNEKTVAWQKANPERTREIGRESAQRIRATKKAS